MTSLFLVLASVIIATKLLGDVARRFGLPAVLGELVAGVIVGGDVLALLYPRDPAMHALGDLGLFVLVFQIGLRTDVQALWRTGSAGAAVAAAGVVLPFGLGYLVASALGVPTVLAVIAGAALTGTSMTIPARVLASTGARRTVEGRTVLGAALAGNMLGLLLLSVVAAAVVDARVSAVGMASIAAITIGYIAITVAVGGYAVPPLFRVLESVRMKGAVGTFGLALGLMLAAIARGSGFTMIIGAFVAGTIFHSTPQRHEIERTTAQLGHFLVPVFFALLGSSIQLASLANPTALALGGTLVVVAAAAKVAAGFVPWKFRGNRLAVGVAMVPSGEVGMIFAWVVFSTGAVTPELFAAIMLMVVVTTLAGPPLLRAVITRDESMDREDVVEPEPREPDRRKTTMGRRH